ncbi:MAG: hypothetical protein NC419_08540 [Muribaculaceae bacterium]|nr:hypothetical protein [Muribaculaceae bacterium]
MKKIIAKGQYGYIQNRKILSTLRTILFFGISLALYGIGIYSTGSNKNLLTIVAVLGCLPSCKSAVNAVMFWRAKGCSGTVRDKVAPFDGKLLSFYDMYFTSYRENFPISHMVLKGSVLCGYTESAKCNVNAGEKHLEQMLLQDGYKNMTIKIFQNIDKYVDRLSQLQTSDIEPHKHTDDIVKTLYSISL